MLWAALNGSMILSFAFHPKWIDSRVLADLQEMDGAGIIAPFRQLYRIYRDPATFKIIGS